MEINSYRMRAWQKGYALVFQTSYEISIISARSGELMAVYKCFDIMQTTDSPQIYKKARKRYLEGRGISCAFCPYHDGENLDHKLQKNWKKFRKTKFKKDKEIGYD